jgi:hypothetical protein
MLKGGILLALLVVAPIAAAESTEPHLGPSLQFVRFTRIDGNPQSEFRLVNDTITPFYYPGVSDKAPIYTLEQFERGTWREAGPLWCTMGSSKQTLAARSSVYFLVSLSGLRGPFRVRLDLY